jgi:hypothetical protein
MDTSRILGQSYGFDTWMVMYVMALSIARQFLGSNKWGKVT